MNPSDIVGIVERIAELLTPGAQRAWEIAVRQVSAQAIAYLAWAIVGIVGTVIAVVWAVRVYRKMMAETNERYDSMGRELAMTGLGILAIVALIIAGTNLNNAILYLVNPEYQAIRILLGLVGR